MLTNLYLQNDLCANCYEYVEQVFIMLWGLLFTVTFGDWLPITSVIDVFRVKTWFKVKLRLGIYCHCQ